MSGRGRSFAVDIELARLVEQEKLDEGPQDRWENAMAPLADVPSTLDALLERLVQAIERPERAESLLVPAITDFLDVKWQIMRARQNAIEYWQRL